MTPINMIVIGTMILAVVAFCLFIYLFICIRLLIREVIKNVNEVNYKVGVMNKNREHFPEIEGILKELISISDKLKLLNDNFRKRNG